MKLSPKVHWGLNMIIYCVMKTQGDIFVDMIMFDRAIKVYKTLKDFCHDQGPDFLRMKMKAFEQIAVCYRACNMYNVAITYFKKALIVAYLLYDPIAECYYYERLSIQYMNLGDMKKMTDYHNRAFHH